MQNTAPSPFNYRVSAKIGNVYPGTHAGQIVGVGEWFKRHVPLIASPDPRRIDLRTSVLDPFGQFNVKVFRQASQLTVYLLADLSPSMGFRGDTDKRRVMSDCLHAVAESALLAGDRFGFFGCAAAQENRLSLNPANNSRGRVKQLAEALLNIHLQGDTDSLVSAARRLPSQPALVFLLSDFHLPAARIEQIMQTLVRHFVVPLVIWDKQEYLDLPAWGAIRLQDMENGKQRTLLLRPALKQRIIGAYLQRKKTLLQVFRSFGCEPVFMEDGYRAEQLNRYFLQHPA